MIHSVDARCGPRQGDEELRLFLIDARWLGRGGPGRATELLLQGLCALAPEGLWTVWGPEQCGRWLWGSARHIVTDADPQRMWGQTVRIPAHDAALFLHQIRPLRGRRPATVIHDTIPLRYASKPQAFLKRTYLRAIVARTRAIVTVSEYSRRCIARDLNVSPDTIEVVRFPVDHDMVERVLPLRSSEAVRDVVLAVGRDAPHKNLDRLIAGFAASRFARDGGSLTLAGIQSAARPRLSAVARREGAAVEILGIVTQSQLESLYATARCVVMPSLEEGFGLPAWEAMSCGIPVALADTGSLPEIGGPHAFYFSPTSTDEMGAAIDRAADSESFDRSTLVAPSLAEFASVFVDTLGRVLGG